jgi:hypothetical protein
MFKKKTFIMQCVKLALLYVGIYLGMSLIDLSCDMIQEKRHPENDVLSFEQMRDLKFEQRRDIKLEMVSYELRRINEKIRSQGIFITILLIMAFAKMTEKKEPSFREKVEMSETKNEGS